MGHSELVFAFVWRTDRTDGGYHEGVLNIAAARCQGGFVHRVKSN